MLVGVSHADDQRCIGLGEAAGIGGVLNQQHLGDAVDLGGFVSDARTILTRDQHVDIAAHR